MQMQYLFRDELQMHDQPCSTQLAPPWPSADARMQAVVGQFRRYLQHMPPVSARIGAELLGKLTPPKWELEWYLPRWLGESLGLAAEVTDDLVLANGFGLCFIVLEDRLQDEALTLEARHDARHLSKALHHWWLAQNTLLCSGNQLFWGAFARIMEEWRTATAVSNDQPGCRFDDVIQRDWRRLAHRASPLKVCCVAATQLADRPALLAPLERSLDDLHVAAVLLDHAQDWMDDLAGGRYNAFVHDCMSRTDSAEESRNPAQTVMEELWFGDGGRAYFATAHARLDQALAMAEPIGCVPFCDYLVGYHARLDRYQHAMQRAAHDLLDKATAGIFGESGNISQGGDET